MNLAISIRYEFLFKLSIFKKSNIFRENRLFAREKVMGFRLGFPFQSSLLTARHLAQSQHCFMLLSLGNTCPGEQLFNGKVFIMYS